MALIPESEMPHTRLELRWTKTGDPEWPERCDYNLVIELWRLDIRGERLDDDGNITRVKEQVININQTRSSERSTSRVLWKQDRIDVPFRDSSHIRWDRIRLGGTLPMFAVAEGMAMPIEPGDETLPGDAP